MFVHNQYYSIFYPNFPPPVTGRLQSLGNNPSYGVVVAVTLFGKSQVGNGVAMSHKYNSFPILSIHGLPKTCREVTTLLHLGIYGELIRLI